MRRTARSIIRYGCFSNQQSHRIRNDAFRFAVKIVHLQQHTLAEAAIVLAVAGRGHLLGQWWCCWVGVSALVELESVATKNIVNVAHGCEVMDFRTQLWVSEKSTISAVKSDVYVLSLGSLNSDETTLMTE